MNRLVTDFGEEVDHLLLINPDVELAPDAIDQLIAASLASESEAIVGGQMMRFDGSIDPRTALNLARQSVAFALGLRRWPGCNGSILMRLADGAHWYPGVPVLTGATLLISQRDCGTA